MILNNIIIAFKNYYYSRNINNIQLSLSSSSLLSSSSSLSSLSTLSLSLSSFEQSYMDILENDETNDKELPYGDEVLLYADDDILVYDKPSNIQSAPGFRTKFSLATKVANTFKISRIDHMIAHRLDYATSGVIVYARNLLALSSLHNQFRYKKVYKKYSAIVNGYINNYEGEINLPLGKDIKRGPPLNTIDINGKNSLTYWKLYERCSKRNLSHVHLYPQTGRTHQLRIHMTSIGHPILGDLFYAPRDIYLLSPRLLLHAEELRLFHPRTNLPMKFIANSNKIHL